VGGNDCIALHCIALHCRVTMVAIKYISMTSEREWLGGLSNQCVAVA